MQDVTARVLVPVAPLQRLLTLRVRAEGTVEAFLDRLAHDVADRSWPPVRFSTARQRVYEILAGRYKTMDMWWADRFACALDRHPAEIWDEAWWEAARLMDDAGDDLKLV